MIPLPRFADKETARLYAHARGLFFGRSYENDWCAGDAKALIRIGIRPIDPATRKMVPYRVNKFLTLL